MIKKLTLFTIIILFTFLQTFAQQNNFWTEHGPAPIPIGRIAPKPSMPTNFKLFDADLTAMQQYLLTAVRTSSTNIVFSLPNADGILEEFELVEASNFEPTLQAKFSDIRSFSGKGITDKTASIKLSISPQGIQTMVFRSDKEEEYIEPYTDDKLTYSVFKSQRKIGQMPWNCSTVDPRLASALNQIVIDQPISIARSGGNLKILKLKK